MCIEISKSAQRTWERNSQLCRVRDAEELPHFVQAPGSREAVQVAVHDHDAAWRMISINLNSFLNDHALHIYDIIFLLFATD